jgi:membrane protease YdiL (CAAX protease family)
MVAGFFVMNAIAHAISRRLHLAPLISASVVQLAIFLVAVIFALADGGGFRSLGVFTRWKPYDFAAVPGVIIVHVVGSIITYVLMAGTGTMSPDSMDVMSLFKEFGHLSFGQFAAIGGLLALQAGIGEELLFRGYLITRLERLGLGAFWCIVLSGMIFGLIHVPSGYGWIASISKGIWFGIPTGVYFWYRRNLGPLMAGHALMDFLGFVALYAMLKLAGGTIPGF